MSALTERLLATAGLRESSRSHAADGAESESSAASLAGAAEEGAAAGCGRTPAEDGSGYATQAVYLGASGVLTVDAKGVRFAPTDDEERGRCCACCCATVADAAIDVPKSDVLGATSASLASVEELRKHAKALNDDKRRGGAVAEASVATSGSSSAVFVWRCVAVRTPAHLPAKRKLVVHGPFVVSAPSAVDAAALAKQVSQEIRRRATFRSADRPHRLLVLVNPFAGKGAANATLESLITPVLGHAAGAVLDVRQTTAAGDAEIYARQVSPEAFDACLCVGGDGTVHEALQGLCGRSDWRAATARLPLLHVPSGSGNGFAASSGIADSVGAARAALHGLTVPLDVLAVLQPRHELKRYGILGLAYGLVASCDIGTEHLRHWGDTRFTYGAICELISRRTNAARVAYLPADGASALPTAPADAEDNAAAPVLTTHRRSLDSGVSTPILDAAFLRKDGGAGVSGNASFAPAGEEGFAPLGRNNPAPPGWCDLNMPENDVRPSKDHTGNFQLCMAMSMAFASQNDKFAPDALLGDGSVHLVYTGLPGLISGLGVMLDLDTAQHIEKHPDAVSLRRCRALYLEPIAAHVDEHGDAEVATWLTLDGEALRPSPTLVEVKPGLCRAVVAPECPDAMALPM